ncbi:MAG: heme-copper oxidase subunit III [Candidatus Marinimicrobia bacterium]|jgi:heme/copper-type cytochrome/quinol oxidase subunit 3|nr:heme-copper oxidase subunit III [Candidatus Neomarinimicrobiota bacterium]MDP6593601.1 heme-copper oxidase subunit III [Candidatus Neomarinimicrobiota bacterium]MDP6836248.1 heme-copper oxidase subunit III [Candidatus Neomarinimicrobiota bacterium]MDP6966165.1 heme-copper oxidase subunit III [Candidatus Neomarinimicrobiota bacterium]|tara:strand:- start:8806 stop:9393 length:588 start_codon:yes stop_codon:yes gene_type:complete
MTQAQALAVSDPFGKATTGKLGMWLFIIIDGLSFAGLLIGGAALRSGGADWPQAGEILNIPLTAFNTFLLICTSFTMVMALNSIQKGDQAGLKKFLTLTMAGGLVFLGIQVWEYVHFITDGFIPSTSIYAAVFYVTTGFHGLHVTSGVIYIACILWAANQGRYSADNWDHVEILGLFWHFVDLIWIFVFTVIYLI